MRPALIAHVKRPLRATATSAADAGGGGGRGGPGSSPHADAPIARSRSRTKRRFIRTTFMIERPVQDVFDDAIKGRDRIFAGANGGDEARVGGRWKHVEPLPTTTAPGEKLKREPPQD